jgi:TRAP-type C4-dicarboxylate transport system permease small subunit
MQQRLAGVARVLGTLSTLALWISAAGMIAMTALVAWQVFTRYVLNASPSWTEPASVMIMSWFIFLGAAVGVRENFHMGFDVLVHFLPARATPWMRAISDLAVLGLPGGFTYMPLAAGGLLITIFALERLVLRAAGVIVDHDPNAEDIMLSEA